MPGKSQKEEYGITLARYSKASDSYCTSSLSSATHIVYYGDGAMVHAEPIKKKHPKSVRRQFDRNYSAVQKVAMKDLPKRKLQDSIDGRVYVDIAKGVPVHTLTHTVNRISPV